MAVKASGRLAMCELIGPNHLHNRIIEIAFYMDDDPTLNIEHYQAVL